jgi:hypothetical protein
VFWALHVTGGLSEDQILQALHMTTAASSAAGDQLACENREPTEKVLERLMSLLAGDDSPVVVSISPRPCKRIEPENAGTRSSDS